MGQREYYKIDVLLSKNKIKLDVLYKRNVVNGNYNLRLVRCDNNLKFEVKVCVYMT